MEGRITGMGGGRPGIRGERKDDVVCRKERMSVGEAGKEEKKRKR